MPVSVYDVLKQSGFTDEAIADLDQQALTGFSSVLSTASAEHEAAEQARRENSQFYESHIAPGLNQWGSEKARLEAENAYYRQLTESARASGFIPSEPPGSQPRDGNGRYVANVPGGTPGSPVFQPEEVIKRAGDGLAMISDIDWRYRQLFDGKPMPLSPSRLIEQADKRNMDPMSYAEQAFGFAKREQELQVERQKTHDDKIKQDAVAERDKYWAEKVGSNPDVRQPQTNPRYTEIQRVVKAGTMPDPLMLNDEQRRNATRAAIRQDLVEQ
jgi:hypothetical protein